MSKLDTYARQRDRQTERTDEMYVKFIDMDGTTEVHECKVLRTRRLEINVVQFQMFDGFEWTERTVGEGSVFVMNENGKTIDTYHFPLADQAPAPEPEE